MPFRVPDLIQAHCMFASLQQLNLCCRQVLAKIEKTPDCELLELNNRLDSINCDIVLSVLIEGVVGQLRLVRFSNPSSNHFLRHLS